MQTVLVQVSVLTGCNSGIQGLKINRTLMQDAQIILRPALHRGSLSYMLYLRGISCSHRFISPLALSVAVSQGARVT